MLPAGRHVRRVYLEPGGLIETAAPGTLLIDSSTIDIDTSRLVGSAAVDAGLEMIDAPVTGGVMAARVGKLNFIVGGTEAAFERAEPILSVMGKKRSCMRAPRAVVSVSRSATTCAWVFR